MDLNSLNHEVKGRKGRKRIGRGNGSGWGQTAGRGHKGQKSRSGHTSRASFEGGQMPLFRRIPKRGFNNKIFRKVFVPINIEMLKRFPEDSVIEIEDYKKSGMVKNYLEGIKILGTGEMDRKLTVTAHKFSATAREKIEKAGGTCIELIPHVDKATQKAAKKAVLAEFKKAKIERDAKSQAAALKKESKAITPEKDSKPKAVKEKPKPKKDDKKK